MSDDKAPDKRNEFQAFKSLTRRLVAVPKAEIERRPKRRVKKRR